MNQYIKKLFLIIFITLISFFSNPIYAELITTTDNASAEKTEISYLYIQTARSGDLTYDKQKKLYTLNLYDIDPWAIYFSIAPHKESGFLLASDLSETIKKEISEKYHDGLNSGLTSLENDKATKPTKYVLVLKGATYDESTHTMSYIASILNADKKTIPAKIKFRHTALFIDNMDNGAGGGSSW